MFKLFRILLFIFTIYNGGLAHADSDPYGNCIKGYDFGIIPTENIIMAPISPSCQSMCGNECNSFSRKTSIGIELNSPAILDCLSACKNGQTYVGYYFEEEQVTSGNNVDTKLILNGPITTKVTCSSALANSGTLYTSQMKISSGDKITLSLVTSDKPNKIYLCGRKAVELDPLIKSLDSKVWEETGLPQTALTNRNENMCAMRMNDSKWNNLTNKAMSSSLGNDICSWNSRNDLFTDTGLWVKDGDELSISWQSTHIYWPNFGADKNLPSEVKLTRLHLFKIYSDPAYAHLKSRIAAMLIKQSSLLFLKPNGDMSDPRSSYFELNGERARTSQLGDNYNFDEINTSDKQSQTLWFGLQGSVIDNGYKITPKFDDNCNTDEKRTKNIQNCNTVVDPGIPSYFYSGVLKGFSDNDARLAIRTYDHDIKKYYDNLGGVKVNIEWGGCIYSDGQMLQYAISETQPKSTSSAWINIPQEVFNKGSSIIADNTGYFYLRIKPLAAPIGLPIDQLERYNEIGNRSGQYYLNLSKATKSSFIFENGPIKILVKAVRSTLFGDPSHPENPGVIEKLFRTLVKESAVVATIRAVLVLYVAFTGIGYIIGIIQMSQYDLVVRLLKFSFVATMISPTSWEFFSQNFFKIFIEGGLELIGKIVDGSLENFGKNLIETSSDPTNVFAVFDGPFQILFKKQLWFKIVALLTSSTLGWCLAALIIVALIFYALSLAKATLMFLISMVITSLLILIAPVFFCFMLFNTTKPMFDTWWKFLVSFTLQPVAIFTSISIFTILIISTLFSTLGFSVCPSCLFAITIPNIVDFCLIPTWRMLAYSHFPSNSSFSFLPSGLVSGVLILVILCHGMFMFCDFIAAVINRIVSGQMINETSLESYGSRGLEIATSVVGIDQESKNRRYIAQQEKYVIDRQKQLKQNTQKRN